VEQADESDATKGARSLQLRPIESIRPYDKNPRTHTPAQIAAIARSIERFGFTNPILLDGENGIIAGHGRLAAAQQLGFEHVPCVDLNGLTAAEQRAYVIADNQLALQAGWDYALLALDVEELAIEGFDVTLLGFSDKEMSSIERMGTQLDDKTNSTVGGDRCLLLIEFATEPEQQIAFVELQERGWNVKVLT